jgi:protoporphyrinogen oxidase
MDVIIIGAGISGLYLATQLVKRNKNVLLIEKSNRIGGRIYTKKVLDFTYESGAVRFSDKNKLLIELLNYYKLDNHIVKILSHNKSLDGYYQIIKESLENNQLDLSNISTLDYLNDILGVKETDFFIKNYGYKGNIIESNAICGITMLMNDYNSESYYMLEGGLQKLVEHIHLDFIQHGGKLLLNTDIKDIYKSYTGYKIVTDKHMFDTPKLVLAVPKKALMDLKPITSSFNFIKHIHPVPLLKIYFVYKETKPELKNVKRVNFNNDIRFIIPINENILMILYSDNCAQTLYNLYKEDKNKFINKLIIDFQETTAIELQKSDQLCVEYWDSGVHLWKPGFDQIKNYSSIIQPLDNLYLSNEAYSLHQGWIEGSLSIANDVLSIL